MAVVGLSAVATAVNVPPEIVSEYSPSLTDGVNAHARPGSIDGAVTVVCVPPPSGVSATDGVTAVEPAFWTITRLERPMPSVFFAMYGRYVVPAVAATPLYESPRGAAVPARSL